MSTSDAGQRRASLPPVFSGVRNAAPALQAGPVESPLVGELSLDPPAAHHSPTAARLPLAPHSEDVQAAQPGVRGPLDQQMANHIVAMQAEARQANATFDSFDSFDPAALRRTRDLLVRLGRGGEAIPLQRRILQFLLEGPEELAELKKMAELYLKAGMPHEAIDAISKARLDFGRIMDSQTRAEMTRSAVLARLLAGDPKAKEELKLLGVHHYDDHAVMLQAMIKHAGGDRAAAVTASRGMRSPAQRVLLLLWCNRPSEALAILDEFVRTRVPQPGVALPKDVQELAEKILSSPIVAASPSRDVLTASDSWKLLRERCQPAALTAIAVDARLPDLKPHVLTALADMKLHDLAQIVAGMDVHTDDAYRLLSSFYRNWSDPLVNRGVTLEEKGCKLLAEHFNRKYGTQISVNASLASAGAVLAELIERAARAPGDVRSSLNFGVAHGVCTVYIREQGKEALFLFDSIAESGEAPAEGAIREAQRRIGRRIPVYRQAIPTQSDSYSCFVQSMKAAVTLTRRVPGEDGETGRFLIPNLISELESTSIEVSSLDSFIPTNALSEIAKMTQSLLLLQEQLRARPDGPLRDSRNGLSLQEFVSAHSVPIQHLGKRVDVFDYSRKKGLRYARNIDVESWNQAILRRVGPHAWSPAQQNEFAARVKALAQPHSESEGKRPDAASPG